MFIAIGLAIAGLGVALIFVARGQQSKATKMSATDTSTVRAISDIAKGVASEIGAGSFGEYTELKGQAVPQGESLVAPFSNTPSVYYKKSIIRHYRERYWKTDSEGKRVRETRRGSEAVEVDEKSVPFELQDGTGGLLITLDDADITANLVYQERTEGSTDDAKYGVVSTSDRQTTHYEYLEEAIPVDHALYALGSVTDIKGPLSMRKPTDGQPYIISTKSEEELKKDLRRSAKVLIVLSVLAILAGAALTIIGVVDPGVSSSES